MAFPLSCWRRYRRCLGNTVASVILATAIVNLPFYVR